MYQEHFHFKQAPFSIAPDPSFLYLSDGHSEALAHLLYGFSHGGFVLITGEVGTGKTTLLRNLVKQTPPDLDVAFILNPRLTVKELLETLCDELGIPHPSVAHPTVKQYIDALNQHLLESYRHGRSTVVIIDEAQNLSPAVLEQVRLLTNLETDDHKLLRIILLGQPELGRLLERNELRQLAQRITARYHLGALSRADCYAYVVHRLTRAGGDPGLFPRSALALLYRLSRGVPRLVNIIADRSLLGAYVEGRHRVSRRIVRRAAREVLGSGPRYRIWAVTGAASLCAAGIAWAYFSLPPATDPPAPQVTPAPSATETPTPSTPAASANPKGSGPTDSVVAPADPNSLGKAPWAASTSLVSARPAALPTTAEAAASEAVSSVSPNPVRRPPMDRYVAQRKAYAAAFAAWGADYASVSRDTIPCNFAPSAGLQCLNLRGEWTDIEQLNRPVVLELWDEQPVPFHAALLRLRDGALTLQVGDDNVEATARDLVDLWHGQFVLLWQTPPDYRGSLQSGDTHATVGWLRRRLEGLVALPLSWERPNRFEPTLDAAVREFQRAEGLISDGIVGPRTWIRLADRLQLPAPKLDG